MFRRDSQWQEVQGQAVQALLQGPVIVSLGYQLSEEDRPGSDLQSIYYIMMHRKAALPWEAY